MPNTGSGHLCTERAIPGHYATNFTGLVERPLCVRRYSDRLTAQATSLCLIYICVV